MKRSLLLALLLTPALMVAQTVPAAPATPAASATPLDGTWQIDGDVAGNSVMSTCVLTVAEGKIAGTCTGTDGAAMPVTGTVTDASVKWSYESVYNGGKIVLSYAGMLNREGSITGTIYVEPFAADGSFTATRKQH